jgi:hypothetical protein
MNHKERRRASELVVQVAGCCSDYYLQSCLHLAICIATNKVCLLCMKMILLLLSSVFAKGYCKFSPAPK